MRYDMKPEINFDGIDDLQKGVADIVKGMPGGVYNAVRNSCMLVEIRLKTHHLAGATLKARTHRFQHSVKTIVRRVGTLVTGLVGSPVVYAAIHEYGGIIRPKNAKYLVFRINGRFVRTTKVVIPKRAPFAKSLEDVRPQIERIFGREIEIVIE